MKKKKIQAVLTREQFAKIAPLLESAKNKTSPRTLDLNEAFNAVLYLPKRLAANGELYLMNQLLQKFMQITTKQRKVLPFGITKMIKG